MAPWEVPVWGSWSPEYAPSSVAGCPAREGRYSLTQILVGCAGHVSRVQRARWVTQLPQLHFALLKTEDLSEFPAK